MGKGDLLVRIQVWTPESLSRDQEGVLKELAELEDAPPEIERKDRGFWDKLKEALGA